MIDERDEMIDTVRGRLRASVADQADPRAVARILSAAFAAPAPSRWRRWMDAWHLPVMSRVGAAVVAVIALAAGFVARGVLPNRAPADPMAVTGEFPIPVTPASDPRSGAVATQFVFEARPRRRSPSSVTSMGGCRPRPPSCDFGPVSGRSRCR